MSVFEEYEEKFHDNFPVYQCVVPTGKTMEDIARECIKNNRPYKLIDKDKNSIY